jgi:hypothetical protein
MADVIEDPCVYIDKNNDEHQIFCMLINDLPEVNRLISKLRSTEFTYLNVPLPKTHIRGKLKGLPMIDKATNEPILDSTAWDALMKLLEMALRESKEEFGNWVDFKNAMDIIDVFQQISEIKKKVTQQMVMEALQNFSQQ